LASAFYRTDKFENARQHVPITYLLARGALRGRATGFGWRPAGTDIELAPTGGGSDAARVRIHASGSGDYDIASPLAGYNDTVAATVA